MKIGHRRRLALALLASALLTSACGLKPEVKEQLSQGAVPAGGAGVAAGAPVGGVVDPGTGAVVDPGTGAVVDPGTGAVVDPGTGAVTDPGTTTADPGGTTTDPGTAPAPGEAPAPGQAPAPGAPAPGAPAPVPEGPGDDGNTTGIDFKKKVVRIALHGPLTGAGVPQESFKTGTPKYWKGRKLANGFSVEAVAIDDKYNAPDALRACNKAAKEYFLIVGGAGTDQIQACAQSQVLRRGSVPYLSAGVTEAGLGSLPNYFATSLTYKQQGPLVVQMAKDNGFFKGKWAVVITETPNFADARQAIVDSLRKNGAQFNPSKDVYLTDKAPRDCAALATSLRGGQYNTIYFLGQPAFFAQCVGAVGPGPVYTGVGPSFGINTVANLACGGTGGQYKGFFLHPSTGLDQAGKRAPGVRFEDDIEYQIYGAMQGLEKAFNLVQGKLTREKFISALAQAGIPAGISPPAVYKGGSRFGGTQAFALKANCTKTDRRGRPGMYDTLKTYGK